MVALPRKPKSYYQRKSKERYELNKRASKEYQMLGLNNGKTFTEFAKEYRKKHKGK